MPDLVHARLFIGDVNDAIAALTGPAMDMSGPSFTHVLSAVSSTSVSFITDCHSGLAILTKEVHRVVAGKEGAAVMVHDTVAGPKTRGTAAAARQLHCSSPTATAARSISFPMAAHLQQLTPIRPCL
jgi:hypothetical protein